MIHIFQDGLFGFEAFTSVPKYYSRAISWNGEKKPNACSKIL